MRKSILEKYQACILVINKKGGLFVVKKICLQKGKLNSFISAGVKQGLMQ